MVNFSAVASGISQLLKSYKNYKNRLTLPTVKLILKKKMSRFSMVRCVVTDVR